MKRAVFAFALCLSSTGCAELVADASAEAQSEAERHRDVHRWEREATMHPVCTKDASRDGHACGLLSDTLSPEEASAALARHYPHASVAEMRGTCGLDPSCDVRAREMVWLASHNRNVARIAGERRLEEDEARRRRLTVVERIVGVVALSGAVVAVGLGAAIR
jgi:hypothetical protein